MKKTGLIRILGLLALSLITAFPAVTVQAEEEVPYDTYNYNYWEDIVKTPAAYTPEGSVGGIDVGTTAFKEPKDFCI